MAKGMFDFLDEEQAYKTLLGEQRADEEMHQFQAQDPFRAMAHASYAGGTLAGQGLGRTIAALAGRDPRSPAERNLSAIQAAKQKISALGFNPEDPNSIDAFYKNVMLTLRQQGLAGEALQVAQEWEKVKLDRAHAKYWERGHKPTEEKPLKGKDFLLKKYDEIATKLADDPENPQLQKALQNVQTALDKFYPAKAEKGGEWKVVAPTQDSPGYKYHTGTGEVAELEGRIARPDKTLTPEQQRKADEAKQKMKTGYESAFIKAQADYDAAVALHNHPQLEGAVGPIDSIVADTNPAERGIGTRIYGALKSPGALNAAALIQQVKAGAFLTGFQEIKQASAAAGAQGAGFGALSDAEGARIQNAKAALDAAQDAKNFRVELRKYIAQMVASWNALSDGAAEVKITPKRLVEKPLKVGRGAAPTTPAAPAPAPAATPVPMPIWTPEKQRRLDELRRKQGGA